MNDIEITPGGIIECPHCHTKVLPKANNICPACLNDVSDLQGVDQSMVSFTVYESEELPTFCYSCNLYTERTIRVSADSESIFEKFILKPTAPENTSNVIIYLPQCETCAEDNEPEPVEVDYEFQTMKLVVHSGFRDRVLQLRETHMNDEDHDDDA